MNSSNQVILTVILKIARFQLLLISLKLIYTRTLTKHLKQATPPRFYATRNEVFNIQSYACELVQ
jgi:hypothetical protein